jgi:hypothetical protein
MNTTTGGINEKPLLSRRNYRGKVVEGAPPSNIKFDPKTGVLLSAEMVTGPTADQIKTNAIARKLNTDNEKDFQEYLEAWGLNKDIPVPNKDLGWMKFGRTFSTDPDEKQYKKDVAARDEKIAKARAKFPITEVVDQENIVPLTPKEAIDLYSQTWGINIYDAYGSQKNPQGGAAVILDKHAEALKKAGEVEAAVAEDIDYSNVEEAGIARVMKAKRWTREHAIKVLRAADKIR